MELKNPFIESNRMRLPLVLFLMLTFVLLFVPTIHAQKNVLEYSGPAAAAIVPGADYVKQRTDHSFPVFVRFAPGNEIDENQFFQWLQQSNRSSLQPQFQLVDATIDELGMKHQRFVQMHNGSPVDQSHFFVHSRNGKVYAYNGLIRQINIGTIKATLTEEQALEAAKRFVGAAVYMWEDEKWEAELKERRHDDHASHYPKGKLVITQPIGSIPSRLAYVFDIDALSPMKSVRVCVDAINGNIIYDIPMESNCSPATVNTIFNGVRNISTDLYTDDDYRLRDDCTPAVVHVRDWNSDDLTPDPIEIQNTSNTWTTMDEIFGGTSLWTVNRAYAYFLNVHGRDAYDDANGDLNVYINALFGCQPDGCVTADNASMNYSTQTMRIGLSSAGVLSNSYATIDIIGHEYAHAVTASSAGLVYENEWGALNESFSDIFGEAAEFYVFGSNDWLLGEERDDGAIRSMSNPKATGDPDTYLGDNWFDIMPPCDGTNDQCGVHRNSGVQNHWFYLVAAGGSGTNDNLDVYNVTGVGISAAERIAYRNLTQYLGANSDYSDARDGSIQAAIDLFGLCSPEVKAVMDAWYAVGVGDPFLNVTATVTSDYNGTDVSCFGADDGEATATAANGTGFYTYIWSDGTVGNVATGLSAGTYYVTVTDLVGCTASDDVTLTNPPMLSATVNINSDYNGWPISCFGACDGIAEAIPVGGVPPYSYAWSESAGGQTTKIASGLCAGTHSVIVKDANGCTTVADINLTEPPPLEVEAGPNQTIFYYDIAATCTTLMASGEAGGVPPYTYSWSSGGTEATEEVCLEVREDTITIVTYYVTLTDANGCQVTDSLDVCYVDINCGKPGGPTKVTICHIPPDNPNNPQTLCVGLSALPNHLLHGDHVAACDFVSPCDGEIMPFRFYPQQMAIFDHVYDGHPILDVFPNPVAEVSTVRLVLHKDIYGRIELYNIHGQQAAVLFDGMIKAGDINDVEIQTGKYSAGTYMVRLVTDDEHLQMSRQIIIQ